MNNVGETVFKGIYTLVLNRAAGVQYTSATPIYFKGELTRITDRVVAMSASSNFVPLSAAGDNFYLNLYDTKGRRCLRNYPINDLWDGWNCASNLQERQLMLRYFDFDGVDIARSFLTSPFSSPPVSGYQAVRISLYYI